MPETFHARFPVGTQQGKTLSELILILHHPCKGTVKPWFTPPGGGGALGYFLGGYGPPGTPNWHPVLEKNSPKIDTPF